MICRAAFAPFRGTRQAPACCQPRIVHETGAVPLDVGFGSKADMCGAKGHVRFTPESGHVRW
jgi:hypothetical protein